MSSIDDLTAAITALTASVSAYEAAVTTALSHGNNDAAIASATSELAALKSQIDTATAALPT